MLRLRHHRPFLLILFAYLILAGAVSIVNPLFEATDEIRHYRYIRHLVVHHTLPVQGSEPVRSQSHHPPLYYLLSALASGWIPSDHLPEYEHAINPFWGYRNWAVGVDNKLQYQHGAAESFPPNRDYWPAYVSRWVNVLLGAATVYLTYRMGRRLWPQRPPLAWAAATLVGFNPQFLYLSGAMNNDIAAAAASAAVLLLCVQVIESLGAGIERSVEAGGLQRGRLILLGLTYGVALLAKFHLLILGGVIAVSVGLALYAPSSSSRSPGGGERDGVSSPRSIPGLRRFMPRWLNAMAVVVLVAGLVTGWWFVRNWWLYDDPTALNKLNELWLGRPAAGNWWALKQGLPYLWSSLWGRFGYGQIPLPGSIYAGTMVFTLFALVGYIFSGRGDAVERHGFRLNAALLLMGVTVAGFTAVVIYYILIQPAGPMGRFLFPALPAMAILLVEGLNRWPLLSRRPAWTAGGVVLGMGALALVALAGYMAPAVRYPSRAPYPASEPATQVQFGDLARMEAVEVQPTTLRPGEPLYVTLVWEPLHQTDKPYVVYVHLIDEAGVLIAQRDTWPGLGRAPTTAWQPGRLFVDTYRVDLPETAYAPNQAEVRVGLYEPTTGRLPVVSAEGGDLGDGLVVDSVTLNSRPGPWPNPQDASFNAEIALVGYTLEPRALAPGETCTLTLWWEALHQPLYDYSVFAQVIDPSWQVWGSRDGSGPNWPAGEVVQDVRRITLLPETPPGSYPVQVGLFHRETGRLPVVAPEGHHIDDRVLLGPLRVQE